MFFAKVTVVGVGLLGGSLGLGLKRAGLAGRVHGAVRRAASVPECLASLAVDDCTTDLAAAVRDADLVVLGTPVAQMPDLARQMQPHLRRGALVTDVGSVKAGLVQTLESLILEAGGQFVGSHPMAGSERTGVKAARADLFQDAVCVVTPTPATDPAALRTVEALWTALGARVLRLDPAVHDAWVARSSHLPHAVASVLSRCVLDGQPAQDQLRLCASGFRDTTRVASGSPEMWRDIALANAQALGDALAEFDRRLQELRKAVAARDGVALLEHFTTAKQLRDRWINTQPRSGAPTDRAADTTNERSA